jgi:predicted ATPase
MTLRVNGEGNRMLNNRITKVTVHNYRSLGDVSVELDDLTVLVGPNGSGKSNFLDVLRFVKDALQRGLDAALIAHDRGGIGSIRRYSSKGRPYDISIRIELQIGEQEGYFAFTLSGDESNVYRIEREEGYSGSEGYEIAEGHLTRSTVSHRVAVQERNLTLPLLSNLPEFTSLYDLLTRLGFYSVFPNNLRLPQRPGNPYPLDEHGDNLSAVLRQITKENAAWQGDLNRSLARIIPSLQDTNTITIQQVGSYLVVRLNHADGSSFDLALESDGTLRVLGLLTALYQSPALPLIGIEEPELYIHPHALAVLNDVLLEASHRSQIILTTHSPDMISRFPADSLRIVELDQGVTQIGRVREDQRQIIHDQLFSGGDLLRMGELARE